MSAHQIDRWTEARISSAIAEDKYPRMRIVDMNPGRSVLIYGKDAIRNLRAACEAAKEECRPQIIAAEADRDHWRANHDNVVAKLRLFTQRDDLPVDRLPAYEYVVELEKKLAEAQARNAQVLSVVEKMRCAGGPQEFQYWFDELKSFLLRKQDLSALDAAIAAAKGDSE